INVSQLLKDPKLGYEVVVINNATSDQILSKAQEIGQGLAPTSTVFFYYSGHGSDDGSLISQGFNPFRMSDVAKRISQGYGKGKFKRFIAVMDSCFSGQNVNGDDAMFLAGTKAKTKKSEQQMLQSSLGFISSEMKPKADGDLPFEQALILSAAQKNQESEDMGGDIGGAFTASWMTVMKSKLGQSGGATIQTVLDETKRTTESNTGGAHSPAWKAMPESMLSEPLGGGSGPAPASLAADIFVAYGDAANGAMVFLSIPDSAGAGSAELCKGEKVACSTGSGQKIMSFVAATDLKLNSRAVFRGENSITPVDGETLTVVLRKSDGSALEARSYVVKKK
ncbi:MAG: caspase family protein, partial [Pseudomonadota bacterium]